MSSHHADLPTASGSRGRGATGPHSAASQEGIREGPLWVWATHGEHLTGGARSARVLAEQLQGTRKTGRDGVALGTRAALLHWGEARRLS